MSEPTFEVDKQIIASAISRSATNNELMIDNVLDAMDDRGVNTYNFVRTFEGSRKILELSGRALMQTAELTMIDPQE